MLRDPVHWHLEQVPTLKEFGQPLVENIPMLKDMSQQH